MTTIDELEARLRSEWSRRFNELDDDVARNRATLDQHSIVIGDLSKSVADFRESMGALQSSVNNLQPYIVDVRAQMQREIGLLTESITESMGALTESVNSLQKDAYAKWPPTATVLVSFLSTVTMGLIIFLLRMYFRVG